MHKVTISLEKAIYPGERTALLLSLLLLAALSFGALLIRPSVLVVTIVASLIYIRAKQGQLLGNSALVTSTNYIHINNLVTIACDQLEMKKPRVHVVQDPYLNAFALGFTEPFTIVLHSALLENLTDDELLFVIGHELGHIKRRHTRWLSFIAPFGRSIPGLDLIFKFWQRKAEYTCDRFGLIACGNLNTSLSTIIKISSGPDALNYTSFHEFAKQAQKAKGSTIDSLAEVMGTHPYITNRIVKLLEFYNENFDQYSEAAPTHDHHRILRCPNEYCQTKLRLPRTNKNLLVTCPKCQGSFRVEADDQ